jgi:thymidylate synthase (FAD)
MSDSTNSSETPSRLQVIEEPSVYLLARQTINEEALGQFLADEGVSWSTDSEVAAERLVEVAGRICYMSYAKPRPGGNEAYIDRILESRHGSVTEHAVWTILITGISRSLSHELVRHRLAAYSQLSQRYVDESQARFVVPAVIAASPTLRTVWENAVQKAQEAYLQLVDGLLQELGPKLLQCRHCEGKGSILFPGYNEPYPCGHCHCSGKDDTIEARTALRKECRQAARSVLPNATETKITVTMNTRAWRHFLEMRCSQHAEREIRVLAYKIYQLLRQESDNLFGDYTEVTLPDGTIELITQNRKV